MLAAGLVALSQVHLATSYAVVAAGLALCGLGAGASIGAAMNAVMTAAEGEAGIGASVNSALRNAGGAITVAVAAILTSLRYLPGRSTPGDTPSPQAPAAAPDAGTRR
jgi:hypothetical protein